MIEQLKVIKDLAKIPPSNRYENAVGLQGKLRQSAILLALGATLSLATPSLAQAPTDTKPCSTYGDTKNCRGGDRPSDYKVHNGDDFIKSLKDEVGSPVWGVISRIQDSNYNPEKKHNPECGPTIVINTFYKLDPDVEGMIWTGPKIKKYEGRDIAIVVAHTIPKKGLYENQFVRPGDPIGTPAPTNKDNSCIGPDSHTHLQGNERNTSGTLDTKVDPAFNLGPYYAKGADGHYLRAPPKSTPQPPRGSRLIIYLPNVTSEFVPAPEPPAIKKTPGQSCPPNYFEKGNYCLK